MRQSQFQRETIPATSQTRISPSPCRRRRTQQSVMASARGGSTTTIQPSQRAPQRRQQRWYQLLSRHRMSPSPKCSFLARCSFDWCGLEVDSLSLPWRFVVHLSTPEIRRRTAQRHPRSCLLGVAETRNGRRRIRPVQVEPRESADGGAPQGRWSRIENGDPAERYPGI